MRDVLLNLLLCLLSAALLAISFPLSTPRLMLPLTEELGLGPWMIPGLPLQGGYMQYPWLAAVALLPLLLLVWRNSARGSFAWSYLAGVVWLLLGWCWLGSFGALPVVLLAGFFALPLGLFGGLAKLLLDSRRPAWILWGLPAAWTGIEYLRSFGFWAFPWNLLGASQVGNLPLLQLAEVGGAFAVSFAVVLANSSLLLLLLALEGRAQLRSKSLTDRGMDWQARPAARDSWHALARRQRFGTALCGISALLLAQGYGLLRLWQVDSEQSSSSKKLRAALVQGGLGTRERWSQASLARALLAYTAPSRAVLQSWPEHEPASAAQSALPGPDSSSRLAQAPAAPATTALAPPVPLDFGLFGSRSQTTVPSGHEEPPVGDSGWVASPEDPALLLVWPESCIPRRVEQPLQAYVPSELLGLIQGRENCGLLYGTLGHPRQQDRLENGAVLVKGELAQCSWAGSKVRLVPFGEVLPFRGTIRFLEYPWSSEDLSEGRQIETFEFAGQRLAVQVCFDNVWAFPSRRAVQNGAAALLLITNNSWYELPSGIRQHCDFDILRAVETRRAVGRASTTGWSQLVLPSGRIAASSKALDTAEVVEEWLPLQSGKTAYVLVGDLFAQLCLCFTALLGLRLWLSQRSESWL